MTERIEITLSKSLRVLDIEYSDSRIVLYDKILPRAKYGHTVYYQCVYVIYEITNQNTVRCVSLLF